MRAWHFAVLWVALFIAALASEIELLSYLSYLLLFAGVAMYIVSRMTLEGISVKRQLGQAYAHLGDTIEMTYELRNDHRFGKLWLEIFEESNWPEPLPGRVLSIGANKTRKWKVLVKAARRGRFRLGPIVLRSGDPFGLFGTETRVRSDALLLVYPRVVPIPFWTLPGSFLEGDVLTGQRSLQTTSMVMGIRDYRPGDAYSKIHWRSTARHRSLQVKEFELDKTADLWIYLDLERRWHRGEGEDSTEERCVTVAASVVQKALREHRNVGLVTTGVRGEVLHPDRGTKQFGKLMQYLAEVQVGGTHSLAETIVETLPRLRRGAAALLITPSLDPAWVRPAHTMREASVATQAVIVAPPFETDERDRARRHAILGELAVAGVRSAYLGPRDAVEDLFRGGSLHAA
ncbi:MAG TPA: DUF58 domain-containing protein [Candidatus Limnocylindria bacterium]|nr:DUF58 domain-containing protein [Candidatus Limnocylindria bacterium]